MKLSKFRPLIILLFVVGIFFWRFCLKGLLPIPADTIVGMYHPWRDKVWDSLTAGVPFKNFLITDPVRQQYPWRQLAVELLKKHQLPRWNPYSLAGTPLLANFQSAPFYIFNFLFFIFNFQNAWGILIFLQPLLAGIFMYLYLRHLKLESLPSLFGAISFSFCGFSIAWMEWGTVLHSALWLPLILLSIEKILNKKFLWGFIFVFSLTQSFFAGHLQTFFYVAIFSFIYLVWKFLQINNNRRKIFFLFLILYSLFFILTSVQWRPTWELISLSARSVDQVDWQQPGWFIPWKHLVQFFVPDFFGNPATLNYWGVWNYGEFIGYLGVIPLILVFLLIFSKKSNYSKFYILASIFFLTFALPTPWAKLIYRWQIPFLSTSQPTRLIFLVDFCLAVLAAFGAQLVIKRKYKFKPVFILILFYGILWPVVFKWQLDVSRRNLILPSGMLAAGTILLALIYLKKIPSRLILLGLLTLTGVDLFRFGWKFLPFTKKEYLFPSTEVIDFLKKDTKVFRIMSTDRRIFPPNFPIAYKLQSVDGYDPLYLLRYGELVAASERGKPDIAPPFGFNRIITPQNYSSKIIDLMNVKYILSLTDLDSPKLGLVLKEGETRVYYNKEFFPRTFFVYNYQFAENPQRAIELLLDEKINLHKKVVLEEALPAELIKLTKEEVINSAVIEEYQENQVLVDARTAQKGFLVLTDSYYPGWRAFIDGKETKIYRANYNFRAIIVPPGEHKVIFKYGN